MHTVRNPRRSILVPLKRKVFKGRTSVSFHPSSTASKVISNSSINIPAPYHHSRGHGHSSEMCARHSPRGPQWNWTLIVHSDNVLDTVPFIVCLSFPLSLPHSCASVSWDCLRDKLLALKTLSQHLLQGEHKLSQLPIREGCLPGNTLSIWHASS